VLNPTADERENLKGFSKEAKNEDESGKKEIKQLNRHAPDFQNTYSKIQDRKTEKYSAIRTAFTGDKLNRFGYLFKAREVYHLPRLVSREDVKEFAKLVRLDVYKLGKQIGLTETQSSQLSIVVQGYYSDMGHLLNEVSFFQDYVGLNKKGEKDPVLELHSLVSEANTIKTKASGKLKTFLNEQQIIAVEKWLGWA
jgi:hypothetical protein